jgi:hypothetical protein
VLIGASSADIRFVSLPITPSVSLIRHAERKRPLKQKSLLHGFSKSRVLNW